MIHHNNRRLRAALITIIVAAVTALAPLGASAQQQAPIRFAIQTWPGVTVKTEVARQILDAMGYPSTLQELSPQFVYQGIRTGDVDVSLGAWMPAHKDMVQPLLDDGVAVKYAANLEGAVQGLAVPSYVYEQGIHSVEDLVANGDAFNHKIYAIGSGAAMTRAFQDAVKDDYMGLGDWSVVPSSVAGMLAQVKRKTGRKEAIVFHGWKPHWMDIAYDIRFLEADPEGRLAGMKTTVYTIVATGWPGDHAQPARFLRQFNVPTDAQSLWIDRYNRQDQPVDEVATTWIRENMDLVGQWVDGVRTPDGTPGIEAVRAHFSD
ncbi:hypothetical protein KBTX_03240 [wastewater metagenome]|uniref:ABC-type glycine betaine transport system substrate-binding domain-containing protein n=3 Tax=root TaxID=1 RepID=A0A5B8RGB0_9ZZZZ|nr:glycine betaine ABC transporter substrate-binding protein [Arhodomonas aquaeolei]QEA06898.1 hypothetical protein KBTEX_03240 [uncultured organism]